MENKSNDIFISYASEDKKLAFAISHYLEQNNLRCWIAPRDIIAGSDYGKAIIDGIKSSSIMVIVFTEFSNNSKHVKNEVEIAFNNELTIIPFRTKNIIPAETLEYFLGRNHWLDAIDGKAEDYFHELLRHCSALIPPYVLPEPVVIPKPSKIKYYYFAAVLLLMIFFAIYFYYQSPEPDYKTSRLTSVLITEMGMNFIPMNYELEQVGIINEDFSRFVSLSNNEKIDGRKEALLLWIDNRLKTIDGYRINDSFFKKETGKSLSLSGLPLDDVNAFYTISLPGFWKEVKNFYSHYKMMIEVDRKGWPEKIEDYMKCQKDGLVAYGEMIFYGYQEVLSYAPDSLRKKI